VLLTFAAGSLATLAEARRIRMLRPLGPDELLDFERRTDVYRRSLRPVRGAALVGFVASSILLAFDLSGDQTWAAAAAAAASYAAAFGVEWAARRIVIRRPEPFSRYSALPLAFVSWFLRPFIRPIADMPGEPRESPTNGAPAGGALEQVRELRELVSGANDPAELSAGERKMIQAIGALRQKTVREIMTPRPDMAAASVGTSLQDLVDLMVRSGHNRIPLYEGDMDHVTGLVYARDVLKVLATAPGDFDIAGLARPVHFVPEMKMANEALNEFLGSFIHFAIVVDEYGGVDGLVTLEDLLEEIVGEIEQENEPPETPIQELGPDEAIIDGQTPLDEVNDALGLSLDGDGFETLGGFVLHHVGRVPAPGESFEADGIAVEVLSLDGRRVRRVHVRKLAASGESSAAAS